MGTTQVRHVVVVGAGAAGLSAAWYLEQKGHRVTVLERADQVGGLCTAIPIAGRPYDLGAVLLSWEYKHMFRFVRRYGLETEPIAPFRLIDSADGKVLPLEWLTKHRADTTERLSLDVLRYFLMLRTHHRNTGGPGFRNLQATDLHLPFDQWLEKHGMAELGELFTIPVTCYGYGSMSEIPAAYVLKYMNFGNFTTNLYISGMEALGGELAWPRKLKVGMYGLMTRIAGDLREVMVGCTIHSIERGVDGPRPIRVAWTDDDDHYEVREFDDLIIACKQDPETLADVSMTLTSQEATLFQPVRTNTFLTMVFDVGNPEKLPYGIYSAVISGGKFRIPEPGDPIFMGHLYPDCQVLNAYAYGNDEMTDEAVVLQVREAMGRMGIEGGTLHTVRRWRYFPHAPSSAIRDGFYEHYEALQGKNATWWIGSTSSFECVEDAMDYAEDLVDRRF